MGRAALKILLAAIALVPPAAAGADEKPLDRARAHLARGEFEKALHLAREVLYEEPSNREARTVKAKAHFGLKQWESAVNEYGESMRIEPPSAEGKDPRVEGVCWALYNRAQEQVEAGQPTEAIDTLNDALIWDIDFHPALLRRAEILADLNRLEEAEDEYRTALLKLPRDPDTLSSAIYFFYSRHDFNETLQLVDRLVEKGDPSPSGETLGWVHLTAARIHLEEGHRGKAYRHLKRAATHDPGRGETRALLGELETFRDQARRISRTESILLTASLATLLFYITLGVVAFRVLKRRGLV